MKHYSQLRTIMANHLADLRELERENQRLSKGDKYPMYFAGMEVGFMRARIQLEVELQKIGLSFPTTCEGQVIEAEATELIINKENHHV